MRFIKRLTPSVCLAGISSAQAADLGTFSPVFEIAEPNLLDVIYAALDRKM